jgi:hypothetical protein
LAKREEVLAQSSLTGIMQNTKLTSDGVRPNKKILISENSHKMICENPYSDNKTRTAYAWKNQKEVFRAVKGSQHNFNESVKRKNYFYPHVGIGGGAGCIFNSTGKNKMTLEANRKRNVTPINLQSKNNPKMKVYKRIGESMNRTGKNQALFPNVNRERLNTGNDEKSLLKSGISGKNVYDFNNKGKLMSQLWC